MQIFEKKNRLLRSGDFQRWGSSRHAQIRAVMEVSDPINVKKVRQFLELAGYFR